MICVMLMPVDHVFVDIILLLVFMNVNMIHNVYARFVMICGMLMPFAMSLQVSYCHWYSWMSTWYTMSTPCYDLWNVDASWPCLCRYHIAIGIHECQHDTQCLRLVMICGMLMPFAMSLQVSYCHWYSWMSTWYTMSTPCYDLWNVDAICHVFAGIILPLVFMNVNMIHNVYALL